MSCKNALSFYLDYICHILYAVALHTHKSVRSRCAFRTVHTFYISYLSVLPRDVVTERVVVTFKHICSCRIFLVCTRVVLLKILDKSFIQRKTNFCISAFCCVDALVFVVVWVESLRMQIQHLVRTSFTEVIRFYRYVSLCLFHSNHLSFYSCFFYINALKKNTLYKVFL